MDLSTLAESLKMPTSLEIPDLLVFGGIAAATASLGFILRMQQMIAEGQWSRAGHEADTSSQAMVRIIPSRGFMRAGGFLLMAVAILLLSTACPDLDAKHALFKIARVLLQGLGFTIILLTVWTMAFLVFLHCVVYRMTDAARASGAGI